MNFQTKSPINNSTLTIMKLVAEEEFHRRVPESYSFWEPVTENDFLMRDGAIHLVRDILNLENIKYGK